MKKQKLGALALSIVVASALCVPAMAIAAPVTDATLDASTTNGAVTAAGDSQSILTGKIKVTTLSVSVPTAATFNIDPSIAATDAGTQFTSPTNYKITNSSVVPVWAQITNVAVAGSSTGSGVVALTATEASVSGTTMMFAVSDSIDPATDLAFNEVSNWLTAGDLSSAPYSAFNKAGGGKLAANDGALNGDDEATMYFYGKMDNTYSGWADGDSFTITPTFTIATTAPSVTP